MAVAGLHIAVVGATGALGADLLEALNESSLPVSRVLAVATDRSLGAEIEFQESVYPVEIDGSRLASADLIFLCTPPGAALDYARQALEAEVPCLDLTGALSRSEEVPLRIAGYGSVPPRAPLVAVPGGPTLAWALVLQPIASAAGLTRVVGTLLDTAAAGGRRGIEALYGESLALFNQQEPPEREAFATPVAFDCLPGLGENAASSLSARETQLTEELATLLGPEVRVAVTTVQVPAFSGLGTTLSIETERELDPNELQELLQKAPGVEVYDAHFPGPSTRAAAGREVVMVGRIRQDPSTERGLLLWLAADPLRLMASHAIQLAALRLR